MAIKNNFSPFEVYTKQIVVLLEEAKKSQDVALYLHENGARNILFMLEGLTRIHKEIISDKKLEKWYERFKLLEDLLGQIDHLDTNIKDLGKKDILDIKSLENLNRELKLLFDQLNSLINEKKWLQTNFSKFEKLITTLSIRYDSSFVEKIKKAFLKEIKEINDFAVSINGNFSKLEEEVHEMRRKLRWLSIYAKSTQGIFQLSKSKSIPAWSKKYLKKTILASPHIQLQKPLKNIPIIQLDYYSFIALSFIINALGNIKDQGLTLHLLKDSLKKTTLHIKKLLGKSYVEESILLKKATLLWNPFFKEKVLEKLVK